MVGLIQDNYIYQLGGVTPQLQSVKILGKFDEWTVIEFDEKDYSALQEFSIKIVEDEELIKKAINAPQNVGKWNEGMELNTFGNELANDLFNGDGFNPLTGEKYEKVDDADDKDRINITQEDVEPFIKANNFMRKFNLKIKLRNNLKKIKDIEDDLADAKFLLNFSLMYFAEEWGNKSEGHKNMNPKRKEMDLIADKIKKNDFIKRNDKLEKMEKIFKEEDEILKLVQEKYFNKLQ